MCKKCRNAEALGYYYKHRTERLAKIRARAAATRPERREYDLQRYYGIGTVEYERILAQQGGRCVICNTSVPGGRGRFHVDHDHGTGQIRGLLCHSCNVSIGAMQDDPNRLLRAAQYLCEHAGPLLRVVT